MSYTPSYISDSRACQPTNVLNVHLCISEEEIGRTKFKLVAETKGEGLERRITLQVFL